MTTLVLKKMERLLRNEKVLVELFNENYINIVEISSGNKPPFLENCEDNDNDNCEDNVDKIISKYSSHPSVQKIKRKFSIDNEFELAYASAKDQIPKYK